MLHDLKHAYRMLWQSKGWTLVVLLSLAIGIGATTALFTAVNGLLLQTVAVPEPRIARAAGAAGNNNMRPLLERLRIFDSPTTARMSAARSPTRRISSSGPPIRR